MFLGIFIYALWSTTYPLKGSFSPQVLFKIDPLIMFMTALSERILLPGLLFAVVMVLLTLLLGRFFCGWVCPLGTCIDAAGLCRPRSAKVLTSVQRHGMRRPKFYILAAIAALALIGIQVAWIFDPIVTVARVISLNVIPAFTLAIDWTFQTLIQKFGLYDGVYDVYRSLKEGLLGVSVHFFHSSFVTLVFFSVICAFSWWLARAWCRMLCPCGSCVRHCRMGAIEKGMKYNKGECILCMDCVYDCPERSTGFSFNRKARE